MSRIERIQTFQGHPVPTTGGGLKGPFPPELYTSMPVIEDYEQISGNGGEEIPIGGTAQNNYRPHTPKPAVAPRLFRCRLCDDIVSEFELETHVCPE